MTQFRPVLRTRKKTAILIVWLFLSSLAPGIDSGRRTFEKHFRIVSMDQATKKEWNDILLSVFNRLFPRHDWKKTPIEFVLINGREPNALIAKVDGKKVIGL